MTAPLFLMRGSPDSLVLLEDSNKSLKLSKPNRASSPSLPVVVADDDQPRGAQ